MELKIFKNKKILIIDDNELDSNFLSQRLKSKGLDSFVLNKPHNIFETIENEKIEIILLDIIMPEIDGNTVLKDIRLKYDSFELPVIMMSSLDGADDIVNSIKLGANDYITKNVNLEIIFARIYNQLLVSDIYKEKVKQRELEVLNSMIITYNHEINNPLTIAIMALSKIEPNITKQDKKNFNRVVQSVSRIRDIVLKIKEIQLSGKIAVEKYTEDSKSEIIKCN